MVATNAYFYQSYRASVPMVLPSRAIRVLDNRPALTAEDIRLHAWINERLAIVHREKHSLWAKARRFLLANHPTSRWESELRS